MRHRPKDDVDGSWAWVGIVAVVGLGSSCPPSRDPVGASGTRSLTYSYLVTYITASARAPFVHYANARVMHPRGLHAAPVITHPEFMHLCVYAKQMSPAASSRSIISPQVPKRTYDYKIYPTTDSHQRRYTPALRLAIKLPRGPSSPSLSHCNAPG